MTITAQDARAVHAEADCLAGPEALDTALDALAADITARLGDELPLVLCVMNGGLIPTAELLMRLTFPLEIDYLHATRYGMETQGQQLEWKAYPKTSVKGRTVLVVDDIFDQGHTLKAVCEYLHVQGAKCVLSAVTVNKLHNRKVADFLPDFVGLDIEDRFLYGFGMDYQGVYRNVKGIYAVKGN